MAAIKILSLAQLKGIKQPIAAISGRSSSRVDFISILHLVLLVALCAVLYFPYLGSTPFFDKGEPREALAVQDILQRGDWAFPLKRAEIIPSKPPLFHWTAALMSRLTGTLNEATVRFPSALYATLGVLLVYCLARKLFSGPVALLSGAILATTLVYENQALNARVDMTLTFFVTLSLVLFYAIYRAFLIHPVWYYAFYAVSGLGMLAKGPLGILLPALVIAAFLTVRREWNWMIKFGFHPGLILTLLIGLGWYSLAITRGGEGFYQRQIVQDNWARFFGGSGHSKSLYYYVSYLFIQGLPWSIFLPCVAWDSFKKGFFSDSGTVFFKVWLLAMFVFLSRSSGKRPVYLLPLYPALSVLMAAWFYQDEVESRARLILYRSFAVLAGLIGFTLLIAVLDAAWNHDSGWLFELIEGLFQPKDRVSLMLVKNSLTTLAWPFTMVVLLSAVLWFYLAQRLWVGQLRSGAQCSLFLTSSSASPSGQRGFLRSYPLWVLWF